MKPTTYWAQPIELQARWWYDLDKPAHVALIACALAALTPLSLLVTAVVAAALYFGVGKVLVAIEIIPHGAHKPLRAEAIHWLGELALCALTPALVLATTRRGLAILVPVALVALYALSILATPATPATPESA